MRSVIFILAAYAMVAQSYNIRPLEPWRSTTGKSYKVSDVSISLPDEALGELFFSTEKDRDSLIATKVVNHASAVEPPPMLAHDFLSPVFAILLNTFLLYFYRSRDDLNRRI